MNNLLKLFTRFSCQNGPSYSLYRISIFRLYSQKTLDVNTNVIKDVILYKSDNSRFFKMVNFFGVTQFGFWTYLALTAYQTLRDIPADSNVESVWWRKINFGESKWRNSLTVFSFVIGWGILAVTWIYTLRAVRYLILRKGGKQVTIVTYTPLGHNRMFTLDLRNVSSTQARHSHNNGVTSDVKKTINLCEH